MTKRRNIVGEPRITGYDIVDVLEDTEFLKHFMRRFQMSCEYTKATTAKKLGPDSWYRVYKDCPMTLYYDTIDEIKVMLGRQESSAALLPVNRTLRGITMKAVGDWMCEKEGTVPEREDISNVVHTYPIPFEKYYVTKEIPLPEDKR